MSNSYLDLMQLPTGVLAIILNVFEAVCSPTQRIKSVVCKYSTDTMTQAVAIDIDLCSSKYLLRPELHHRNCPFFLACIFADPGDLGDLGDPAV